MDVLIKSFQIRWVEYTQIHFLGMTEYMKLYSERNSLK